MLDGGEVESDGGSRRGDCSEGLWGRCCLEVGDLWSGCIVTGGVAALCVIGSGTLDE